MTLGQAIASKSWLELTHLAEHYFGVTVDPDALAKVATKKMPEIKTDSSAIKPRFEDRQEELLPWLKLRLMDLDSFKVGQNNPSIRLETTLHVFFLFQEETEEMLERLRQPDEESEDKPARSKMFSTHLIPQPIDRVAAIVAKLNRTRPSEQETKP